MTARERFFSWKKRLFFGIAAMSMIDWSKIDLEEVKEKCAKRRKELEEEEEKKRVDDE